jgi:ribosomal protein L6P/L9E
MRYFLLILIKKKFKFFYLYNKKNNLKYVVFLPNTFFFKLISKQEVIFVFSKGMVNQSSSRKLHNFFLNLQNSSLSTNYFSKKLVLKGLGFKCELFNKHFIKINISYSHPYFVYIPVNLFLNFINNQAFIASSRDKRLLDKFNQLFIRVRKPSIFKDKGIFFYNLLKNL